MAENNDIEMAESNDNIFYETFKEQRPCWPLITCALALGTVAITGMFFNLGVIYVTIRSKSLRSSANYLLALTSFFELLHQHGHLLFLFTALSGINFVEYRPAFYICALALFGCQCQAISMTFTGFDRMITVLRPNFNPSPIKQSFYLGICTIICVLLGVYQSKFGFETAQEYPHIMIAGSIGDLFMGHYGMVYNYVSLIFNSMTIVIYVIVGIAIQIRSAKLSTVLASTEQRNRRIFRSLAIIIGVNISGYLVLTFHHIFVFPKMSSPITVWFVQLILAIFLNISAGSNAPILYWTSEEYRRVFQAEFGKFFGWKSTATSSSCPVQPFGSCTIKMSEMGGGTSLTGKGNDRRMTIYGPKLQVKSDLVAKANFRRFSQKY